MVKKAMLVSIVVPVYKAELYLRRCVDSLLSQTRQDIEVILIDDGSPDGCPEICDGYKEKDHRVKVIHQKNQGVSVARNAGLDVAVGDYIAFVDADDYVGPTYIERFMNEFERHPQVDAVVSGRTSVFADRMIKLCINENVSMPLSEFKAKYTEIDKVMGLGFTWAKFFKAELLKELRFTPGMVMYEDAIFNFYAYSLCRAIRLIDATDYFYNQMNPNAATKRFNEGLIACSKRHYVAGKMFLYGEVEYRGDCFDLVACEYGVNISHLVCDQKLPWKKKKSLMKTMLEDDLYKMVAGCSDSSSLRGRLLCFCCKHHLYQSLRFYWWLRRKIKRRT